MNDHVHLLTKFVPGKSVSEMLNRIKAKASKWVNEDRSRLRKFGWQDGYAAFSVSPSQVAQVRRYIKNQAEHHRRQTFQEEFRALLDRHGIPYDERFVCE
jgi:REP element-mobilizing transposase RayT